MIPLAAYGAHHAWRQWVNDLDLTDLTPHTKFENVLAAASNNLATQGYDTLAPLAQRIRSTATTNAQTACSAIQSFAQSHLREPVSHAASYFELATSFASKCLSKASGLGKPIFDQALKLGFDAALAAALWRVRRPDGEGGSADTQRESELSDQSKVGSVPAKRKSRTVSKHKEGPASSSKRSMSSDSFVHVSE